MVGVAVVGTGYWGPNLVRNLASLSDVEITAICDRDVARAEAVRRRSCPRARVVGDPGELASDPATRAVMIATPIKTHFELGSFFLRAGKDVFIEKPLAETAAQCRALVGLASERGRVLMVGQVFEYNPAVRRIKEYLDRGELGKLFYVYSQRVNLGRIQSDLNALWSFAPHDISILNYWLGSEPVAVSAHGFSYLTPGVHDVCFATLEYPGGIGVHLHLSWLDPRKVRQMTLVGSKKMLVYDDVSLDGKIQVFDKGIHGLEEFLGSPDSFAEFQFQIRTGDLVVPHLEFAEPIQAECRHFIDCVRDGRQPLTDGESGLRVVRVLEALDESLKLNGRRLVVASPAGETAGTPETTEPAEIRA